MASLGIAVGVAHVASPDHLSALATLSAGQPPCAAAGLGLRWGIGHSLGMLVAAGVLIAASTGGAAAASGSVVMVGGHEHEHEHAHEHDSGSATAMADGLAYSCNVLVGVTMLAIGLFGFTRLPTARAAKRKAGDLEEATNGHGNGHGHGHGHSHSHSHHDHHHSHCDCGAAFSAGPARVSDRVLALGVGVVHGLTHVVWVLPVLQQPSALAASTYLATFCVTSTVLMGAFAAAYGWLTRRLGASDTLAWAVAFGSSALSACIGALWLVLLLSGGLEGSVFGGHAGHEHRGRR